MGKDEQIIAYAAARGVEKLARSDIAALARNHGPRALEILVEIMDSKRVKPQHRIVAAKEVLARGYGTPTIHIDPESASDEELESTVRQILAKRAGGSELEPASKALPEPEVLPKVGTRKKRPRKRTSPRGKKR